MQDVDQEGNPKKILDRQGRVIKHQPAGGGTPQAITHVLVGATHPDLAKVLYRTIGEKVLRRRGIQIVSEEWMAVGA